MLEKVLGRGKEAILRRVDWHAGWLRSQATSISTAISDHCVSQLPSTSSKEECNHMLKGSGLDSHGKFQSTKCEGFIAGMKTSGYRQPCKTTQFVGKGQHTVVNAQLPIR